jgi:hypothetical protein
MPTECSAERSDFGMAEGRVVEAAFDAGLVTSDAGGQWFGRAPINDWKNGLADDTARGTIARFIAAGGQTRKRA